MLHNHTGRDRGAMPTQDRVFRILCMRCTVHIGEYWCDSCEDPVYCAGCFAKAHGHGHKYLHVKVDIGLCPDCEDQVVTRWCAECGDDFCDTCYYYSHRRGRRMDHHTKMAPNQLACEYCGLYAARYVTLALPQPTGTTRGQQRRTTFAGAFLCTRGNRHRCYDCGDTASGLAMCKSCLALCHDDSFDPDANHTRVEDVRWPAAGVIRTQYAHSAR